MNSYTTNKTNKSFEKKLPFYYLGGVFVFLFAFVLYQQSPVFKAALLKDSSFAAEGASAEYKASNAYNQDGDPSTDPYDATTTLWFGNGQSTDKSYLGLYFTNVTLPPEQSITKAMLQVTSSGDSWISQSTTVFAEKSTTPQLFSKTAVPGQRALTASSVNYSDDVKWRSNKAYTFPDITSVVKEIAGQGSTQNVAIILKGTSGGSWGRKFIYGTSSDNAPKLIILSNMGSGGTNTNSPHPTTTPVVTTTPTARASATPTATKTPAPTSNPTPTMSPMPMPSTTPQQVGWSSQMGRWAPNPLWDTCTQAQHDAYNVVGPDGKTYPTWHPPIDPKTGCHFGHEHGADPRTSLADSSMPAFGYVGEQIGMVEPHAGFKVFVINKGDYTIEGAAPASWRSVIHMGTAGV